MFPYASTNIYPLGMAKRGGLCGLASTHIYPLTRISPSRISSQPAWASSGAGCPANPQEKNVIVSMCADDREDYCSVRLTGTSSCTTSIVSWGLLPAGCPWIPAKKRTKRRPSGRVNSDAQVSQQETPKNCPPTSLSTACGTLKVVKELCICVCVVSFRQKYSPVTCT